LELLEDGITYRYRRIIVLVGRQNGKTLVASVLASWWLHVDSQRHPDRVPPLRFKIVGTAQNLDIAREPWNSVKLWCDPEPETIEEQAAAIPTLQAATAKVSDTNGKEYIKSRALAVYEIRAAKNARGKPAARVIMDELREQKDWAAWNALSPTMKSFWNGQLWASATPATAPAWSSSNSVTRPSNSSTPGTGTVESGLMTPPNTQPPRLSLALFEWSAEPDCPRHVRHTPIQPVHRYGSRQWKGARRHPRHDDAGYRTEDLCQWSPRRSKLHRRQRLDEHLAKPFDIRIPTGARTVWGIDVSVDRSHSWIAAAVFDANGNPVVSLRERRKA
ncbi:terminase, partial [Bifidobacterium longum subsp. longum]